MGVNLSADILDYYADNGEAFLADKNLNLNLAKLSRNSQLGIIWCYAMELSFFIRSYGFAANIMVGTPYY
jgi:succinate-semialdehyde dehydrogenase/glutarate-semialdehyde dehydrogenase